MRDKMTGNAIGYGFVEFESHEVAKKVLNDYQGKSIPNTNKSFKLNWASHNNKSSQVKQSKSGNVYKTNAFDTNMRTDNPNYSVGS